jgi:hypothetical protein
VILAFSAHTFVDKIGAYAGFAAAVGLALFALLLFAQARELRRLREWGSQTHERIAEMERRLAAALELARRAGAPQRTGAATGGTGSNARTGVPLSRPAQPAAAAAAPAQRPPTPASTSAPVRLPLLPAAPAGAAGAALGSATMAVPLPAHPPGAVPAESAAAPVPAPAASVPVAGPPAHVAVAASTPAPATVAAQAPAPPAPTPAESPATVASPLATGNGHHDVPPAELPPRRVAPAPRPAARRAAERPPARPARPAAALGARTASATPRGSDPIERNRRRALVLLGGLFVLLLVVVAVVLTSSGGSGGPSATSSSRASSSAPATSPGKPQTSSSPAPPHSRTVVAVLNGTAVPGLANTVASSLASAGFARGQVGNAADAQRSVTVVSYTGDHEREAAEVAKSLGVPADAVQPIDAPTQASACPGGVASCTATVVVTVGADRQQR